MVSSAAAYEQEVKNREQQRKDFQRMLNINSVQLLMEELGYTIKTFGSDHMQIKKGAKVLSYYAALEKALWVSNPRFTHLARKSFRIKNIEQFLREEFTNQPS